MADFLAFGRGTADLVKKCCSGLDKSDVAGFLSAQQKAIQDDRINERLSAPKTGSGGSKTGSGAVSALERMRAMAGKR